MRKIMSLVFVALLSSGMLAACGDSADALADRCKKDGGTEDQCKCMKERVKDEMSDDAADKAVEDLNDDKSTDESEQMRAIYTECLTDGGTDDGSTDTGS